MKELINRLQKVKQVGKGRWIACCPAHNDKSPSLSISEGGNKLLIHCHSGCSALDVVHAVGLELTDLFNDPLPWQFSNTDAREKYAAKHENHKIWRAKSRLEITRGWLESGKKLTFDEAKKANLARDYLEEVGVL